MAFLVCYSNSIADHARDNAIYLEQQFYELIFRHCRDESSGFTLLRKIALLQYKSPTILISSEQLPVLIDELQELGDVKPTHPQIAELKHICRDAAQTGSGLTISGDMYRELEHGLPNH